MLWLFADREHSLRPEMTPAPADTELPPRWKRLQDAVDAGDLDAAALLVEDFNSDDLRRAFDRLSAERRESLCTLLPASDAADLLEEMPESQAVEVLEELPAGVAADIFEEMPHELGGDILREFEEKDAAAIFAEIEDPEDLQDLRERLVYDDYSAGNLMSDHVVFVFQNWTAGEVLNHLGEKAEEYEDRDVQYVFVTNEEEVLTGVIALRSLVLTPRSRRVGDLMIPRPLAVTVDTPLEDLEDIFEKKAYLGLPVTDADGQLKGVVSREAVHESLNERQTGDYLKASGIVGGEELRSMPLRQRCIGRLAWLAPNILLNLGAASVIAANEATLQKAIALAMFLPIVSDMSGCSGNQAVAVSIRELTLGIIQPRDYVRVVLKEGLLGVINGAVLGILLGLVAYFWKDNVTLGLVIAAALSLNTVFAVLLGGLVPLFLKKLKADPALASGPILTTCTDMCGFFLVLTIATNVIDKLA